MRHGNRAGRERLRTHLMMSESACAPVAAPAAMRRDPATWYGYLLLGFFTFLLNIQGNILPFLHR